MSDPDSLICREKADQAVVLLRELELDAWLTFVRESGSHPDPGIEMVVGRGVTWVSAFWLTARDDRAAIVGRMDASNMLGQGVFRQVEGYDRDIRGPFVSLLRRLDPHSIALNYSTDDHTADGLTVGMYRFLVDDLLAGTPYRGRIVSAGPLLAALRGRKTATEVECIRRAIAEAEGIAEAFGRRIAPGVSERELAGFVHAEMAARGLEPAWAAEGCPLVNTGPESEPGHAAPRGDLRVEPGHLVHIDLGVRMNGYCSDLQRMWYVRRPGEDGAPGEVRRAFGTVVRAIEAAAAELRPGAVGWVVDAAARRVVIEAGYPEYLHGTGHGLGRAVHDGGAMLGPKWPKYGGLVERPVEVGNVFTLELGVPTGAGYVGLEEDVIVGEGGCAFLSRPQRELWVV